MSANGRRAEAWWAWLASAALASLVLCEPLFLGRSALSFDVSDPRLDIRPWVAAVPGPLPEINPVTPDLDLFVLPGMLRIRQLEAQGAPPLWDSRQMLGYPLLANLPSPVHHPAVRASRLFDAVTALDLLLWFHTSAALFLAWLAARRLGAGPAAAAFAAVGFAFTAWMFTRWHLPHIMYVTAWWPGLICAGETLRRGRPVAGAAEAALYAALMLVSGFPQVALVLCGGFVLWIVAQRELRRPRVLAAVGAALLLALLCGLPQLLTSSRAYAESLRGSESARAAMSAQGLPPGALCAALLPEFFGRPAEFASERPPAPTMKEWLPQRLFFGSGVQDNVVENAVYVGALVLLLLPLALRRAVDGRARLLLVLGLLGLGGASVWPWLSSLLPGAEALGAANGKRLIVLWAACAPLAAGLGLQALIEGRTRPPVGWALLLVLLCVLAPLAAGQVEAPGAEAWAAALTGQAARQAALLLAGLGALLLLARRRQGTRAWLPALLLALDVVLLARAFNPFQVQREPFPSTPGLERLADRPGRVAVFGAPNVLPPSAAAVHGISSVHGVAPMVPRRAAELLACIEGPLYDPADPRVGRPFTELESLTHPLLDLLSVSTIVHADPTLAVRTGWPVVFEHPAEGLGALARPGAGPPAFFCGGARIVPDAEARLAALASREFPLQTSVVLEVDPGLVLPEEGERAPVVVVSPRPDRRVLSMQAPFPGLVVLNEAWDPGWVARVDGVPADVLVADHALMAVAVGAGSHEIHLEYRPDGLEQAEQLALLAVALIVALAWLGWVRHAAQAGAPASRPTR